MKADNEAAISLLAYFESVKKRKYDLKKNKTTKKEGKKPSLAGVKPRTLGM